jgi:hypothetical protein
MIITKEQFLKAYLLYAEKNQSYLWMAPCKSGGKSAPKPKPEDYIFNDKLYHLVLEMRHKWANTMFEKYPNGVDLDNPPEWVNRDILYHLES